MEKTLTIFVGFIHDFAAGCWAATVITVYWLDRASGKKPALKSTLSGLERDLFYIGIVCAVIVILAGAGRTFTYVDNVYGEDSERQRRKMLIIKHIILITVFGLGIYWQYTMVFN